ncbi:2-oxoacid:ferredoxin oxidoreductase subunit alpha [Desulfitobacterium sp. THU1]|uniref:2-oxoacid:ferredoxin oxidoreductase subunit alpha n=1 Tax=Desulfitobacterium sp. THU1 TaxID=3138072 RepID=UPI00311ED11D
MALKELPVVPSGDPGSLAESPNSAIQRLYRPVITDQNQVNPIILLYCPDGALSLTGDEIIVSYKLCKGCGICAKESKGIEMVPEYTGPRGIF